MIDVETQHSGPQQNVSPSTNFESQSQVVQMLEYVRLIVSSSRIVFSSFSTVIVVKIANLQDSTCDRRRKTAFQSSTVRFAVCTIRASIAGLRNVRIRQVNCGTAESCSAVFHLKSLSKSRVCRILRVIDVERQHSSPRQYVSRSAQFERQSHGRTNVRTRMNDCSEELNCVEPFFFWNRCRSREFASFYV